MKKEVSPCEHGYYGLCPRCVVEERNALRARVAELEHERDKLQDALAITRNACASRKAQRDEYRHMAECAAIMAICGYFSRMRGPDEWCCVSKDGFTKRRVFTRQLAEMHSREGWTITPLYAGSAPVPAAQAEAKVAHDVAVANVLRDALRAQECNYLCQKSHFDDCLCRACVNERIRAMLAAKAKGE